MRQGKLGLCSSEEIVADFVKVKPRKVFGELLQRNLPADEPDYVLIRLEFVGKKNGETKSLRYDVVDKFDEETGLSAIDTVKDSAADAFELLQEKQTRKNLARAC